MLSNKHYGTHRSKPETTRTHTLNDLILKNKNKKNNMLKINPSS